MKKISLLTIHVGANFGSILQTIASVQILKKMGYDVTVVNYIPTRFTWKYIFHFPNLSHSLRWVISVFLEKVNSTYYQVFLRRFVTMSKKIFNQDNFIENCPKADFYVTGSDQVWNSIHNQGLDKRYYFEGFDNAKKIAFSSSIGRDNIEESEFQEMKRMLSSYKAISVRESNARLMIESMGYDVTHILDPTLLLDSNDWKQIMSKRIVKEKYLLIYAPYSVRDKDLIYKSARVIANNRKLQVVTFTWDIRNEHRADKTIKFANPGDFLSLMFYADYIITTSFHGTAFSINLNKQFSVYLPKGFGVRLQSILSLCGLDDRIVNSSSIIVDNMNYIDYSRVNSILHDERIKANIFLTNALKN